MMIRFFLKSSSYQNRFLPTLSALAVCTAAVAQQATVSPPLSADEVMRRVVQMNEQQAHALETYSSIRSYHLECHGLSHYKADMVVRAEYEAPDKMRFTILSESGSSTVRSRVFKKLLEQEQESMRDENRQRSAITPENYAFRLTDYQKIDANEFYMFEARPLSKNKFLFRGRIWVDAKDFSIAQIEGEPAVNPSWWTVKTNFKESYKKIKSFCLPESNESETKVRIFGNAVLTIKYGKYHITEIHNSNPLFNMEEKATRGN